MTCKSCGRPAENGQATHWLGCDQALAEREARLSDLDEFMAAKRAAVCEHDGCSEPKKEWSGKGAKPKYCADGHK